MYETEDNDEADLVDRTKKTGIRSGLGVLEVGALINTQALSDIFGCHVETIRRSIEQGHIPPPTQMPGGKYWTAGFLLDHINNRLADELERKKKEDRRITRLSPRLLYSAQID